jgi:cytochrome P450
MVKTGQVHHFMTTIHRFMKAVSILSAIPWLTSLANALPTDSAVKDLEAYSRNCFNDRKAKGSSRKDLFYYLLGEDQGGTTLTELELIMDTRTAIVGGSDTTSIALGCLMYYLIAHQDKYKRLQAEIQELLDQGGKLDNNSLGSLPYLGAVINEALRLMPPVPQGLQRVVPPEGMELAGKFIPGNTFVSVSPWTLQRDPRNWGRPDEFIPERWIGEGPEPCNRDAFIPFSIGAYSCVGKPLAMMELRVITATIAKNFDFTFAKGFDVAGFETSMTNDFTMTPPSVRVVASPSSV